MIAGMTVLTIEGRSFVSIGSVAQDPGHWLALVDSDAFQRFLDGQMAAEQAAPLVHWVRNEGGRVYPLAEDERLRFSELLARRSIQWLKTLDPAGGSRG